MSLCGAECPRQTCGGVCVQLFWPVRLLALGVSLVWMAARVVSAQPGCVDSKGEITSYLDAGRLRAASLTDLAFETNGTAWIATSDGLRRYDGYRWDSFGTDHGLPSPFVRTVTFDRDGRLWVGTDHGAGVFTNGHFRLLAAPSLLAGPSVRRIRQDPDGTLWFCCDKWPQHNIASGLSSMSNGVWTTYREAQGLPSDYVYGYFRDSAGRQFVMTTNGVAQRMGQRWQRVIAEPIWDLAETADHKVFGFGHSQGYFLESNVWQTVAVSDPDRVHHVPKGLCVTTGNEVLAYGFGRWTGSRFQALAPLSWVDVNPEVIREAPDGALWLVDNQALMRWDRRPGQWQEYANLPPPRFVDPQGNVVFASESGAFRKVGDQFLELPEIVGRPDAMEMDRAGGIWITATNRARYFLDHVQDYGPDQTGIDAIEGLAKDGAGTIWLYGNNPSTQRVVSRNDGQAWRPKRIQKLNGKRIVMSTGDPQSGIWFSTVNPDGTPEFIHVNSATTEIWRPERREMWHGGDQRLLIDSQGDLWVYGSAGIHFRSRDPKGSWQAVAGLDASLILAGLRGPQNMWFAFSGAQGGKSGFGCYESGKWSQVIAEVPIFMERTEPEGTVTLRSMAAGSGDHLFFGGHSALHVVPHGRPDTWRKLTLPEGRSVPDSAVMDGQGTVWTSVQRDDGQPGVLSFTADGIPPATLITDAPEQVSLASLWKPRVQGIERFNPNSARRNFQYSWRVDQTPWTLFQAFPEAGLATADLRPGLHRFEIRCRDEAFEVQAQPTTVSFRVLPPRLEERAGFRVAVLGIVATIILLAGLAAHRAGQFARLNVSLEQENQVRRAAEGSLQRAHEALSQANSRLEIRVQQRTAELADANVTLRAEMAERQRVEREQRELEGRMQQAQKLESLGVLAGGIAHDFNNLLTAILGHAELALFEVGASAAYRESLEAIVSTGRRAAELCRQMLAYSGRSRFVIEPVDLSTLVQGTAQMLEVSISKNTRLLVKLSAGMPLVNADATQLRQVVMNLVINASEALGEQGGTVQLSTRAVFCDRASFQGTHLPEELPEGQYAELQVIDDGCGMDTVTRARIFDPFFSTKFTGRGLGLAAVLGIVRGHKGAIRVESELGKGTTFTVLLPAATPAASPHPSSGERSSLQPQDHRGRVLLVDDEEAVRTVGTKVLERLGYTVVPASNGQEALALFTHQPDQFDCVLLDLTMPQMDGVQTFRAIRRTHPEVRALLVSGYSEHELAERFSQDGLAGFVQKPYSMEKLSTALSRVIAGQG